MQAAEGEQRRLQARCEELQRSVEAYRDSDSQLQQEIMSLTEQRKRLNSEITRLSGEVGAGA